MIASFFKISLYVKEAEKEIASENRRANRDRHNTDEAIIITGESGVTLWLLCDCLLRVLNYICFGAFRALPWRLFANDD